MVKSSSYVLAELKYFLETMNLYWLLVEKEAAEAQERERQLERLRVASAAAKPAPVVLSPELLDFLLAPPRPMRWGDKDEILGYTQGAEAVSPTGERDASLGQTILVSR